MISEVERPCNQTNQKGSAGPFLLGAKYHMLYYTYHAYQQWSNGNENYIERYMDFVKIVSKMYNYSTEESLAFLDGTKWFVRPVGHPVVCPMPKLGQ